MSLQNETQKNEHSGNRQSEQKFDTPFFVIRRPCDIDEVCLFLASADFDAEEWTEDKANNPLCRLGRNNGMKYPARVATICVRRFNMLDEVKAVITAARGGRP